MKNIVKSENNKSIRSLSDSFKVFRTHRTFTYRVFQKVDTVLLNFIVEMKVIPRKYYGGGMIKYTYKYLPIDINEKRVYKNLPDDTLNFGYNLEFSSVLESDTFIYLHPPRSKTLRMLEVAPFPMLEPNKKEWKGVLTIPKGSWGKWENSSFNHTYKIDSIIKGSNGINQYYYVSSISESKFGRSTHHFIYNTDSGFTKLNYKIENEGEVLLKLIKVS